MGENSERLAKRIMVAQNTAIGCLLFPLALLVLIVMIIMCAYMGR